MRNLRLAGWLCALLLVVSQAAFAQQTTGTILGRVTDDQGAAIPGATVTATTEATGFTSGSSLGQRAATSRQQLRGCEV